MSQQKIDAKILAADLESVLLADKGEVGPELDQKLVDMLQQPFLKGAFLGLLGK